MLIGEKMSDVVDMKKLVHVGIEVYENEVQAAIGRPLDAGRLLYVKLREAIDDRIAIEVYWDHFNNLLTATVGDEATGYQATFKEWKMARSDMIERINALIDDIKRAEPFLLVLS